MAQQMIKITLMNGDKLEVPKNSTLLDIANIISPNLAQSSYFGLVDGEAKDLLFPINTNSELELITAKNPDEALSVIRHSLAHLMAMAVQQLFPDTKFAIGPVVENGFFYDMYPKQPFKEDDLEKITQKMIELIDLEIPIERYEISKDKAIKKYKDKNELFKLDILNNIPEKTVSVYKQGDFEDLCRGPHVINTKQLPKSFKLTKLSGVYWQGNKNKPMLQRINAIAFLNNKELNQFLVLQEELEKYDHRKLAQSMDLFHLQDESVGNIFWHHNGWIIYRELENYIRTTILNAQYTEVKTPMLINKSLWEKSGHWAKYQENMFVINHGDNQEIENNELALRPMNCPAHIQIFKQGIKSYKDLPLRISEFGSCFRHEPSGSLHGIMRVRSFVQDDAHIFCTKEQIIDETIDFCNLVKQVYTKIFGETDNIIVKFSDRPKNRIGSDKLWDQAEKSLIQAAQKANIELVSNKGDGAFYGPKLEFTLKDTFGRQWQLGTLQVDFMLPERLNATYIGEDGQKQHPVMLHRAILGSFERFIGIMLEHFKGNLPLWLSPIQIVLAGVTNKFDKEIELINQKLQHNGIRSKLDLRAEKVNYKIREHSLSKVPIIGIIGEKELNNNTITIRILGYTNPKTISIEQLINTMLYHIENKIIQYDFT